MPFRPKKDHLDRYCGGEINADDSGDLIKQDAQAQCGLTEKIGAILVQIAIPGTNQSRWLTYTAMGTEANKEGYEVQPFPRQQGLDGVEMITCLHHNPWSINVGGVWYWIC